MPLNQYGDCFFSNITQILKTDLSKPMNFFKSRFLYTSLLLIALPFLVFGQGTDIFPKGEKAANINHVGTVYLSELVRPDSTFTFGVGYVVSEAGSRLNWHEHPGGQILFVLDGVGYYQERGKERQLIKKGDVIQCLPGVQHWHGATPDQAVIYMATSPSQNGRTIWHEPVKEEEYLRKEQ